VASQFSKKILRFSVLFLVMLGLLSVLIIRKNNETVELAVNKKESEDAQIQRLGYFDPKRRAETPLEIPDYGEGPFFSFSGDGVEHSQGLYRVAKEARGKISVFKKSKAGKTLNEPLNLPASAEIPTARSFNEKYLKYRLRELESYRKLTKDQGEVKQAGEKFLHAFLLSATRQPGSLSNDELLQLADEVTAIGSKDPLLRTYTSHIQYLIKGDAEAAEAIWRECIEQLRKSQYPLLTQIYLRLFVVDSTAPSFTGNGRKHALIVSIVRWLEEEAESDQDQWALCVHHKLASIWDVNNDLFRRELLVGCLKSDKIDPFIKHWLIGVHMEGRAWRVRGGKWAKDTSEEQFRNFEKLLSIAKVHLEYAFLLRPDSPFPPYKMIAVSLGGVDRDYEPVDWFRRTVEARFDFSPSYFNMLNVMQPRWGGSMSQYRNFARQCILSNRFDTQVPYFVFEILPFLLDGEFEKDWGKLKKFGANKIIDEFLAKRVIYRATHPDENLYGDTAYHRAKLGLFFEKLGREKEAFAEYKAAQGDLDWSQLQQNNRLGKFLLYRLAASQGEVHDRVLAFDEKLRTPWPASTQLSEIDELEQEWQVLKLTAKEDLAKQYYSHTGKILKQLKAFYQDEWVELDFQEKGLGWEIGSNKIDWKKQKQNVLVCRETNQSQRFWARPLINVEAPFHLQVEVDQATSFPGTTQIGIRWADLISISNGQEEKGSRLYVGIRGDWSYPKPTRQQEAVPPEELICHYRVFFPDHSMKHRNAQSIRIMKPGLHLIDWKIRKSLNEVRLGNYPDFIRFKEAVEKKSYLIFDTETKNKSSHPSHRIEYVWKLENVRIRRLSTKALPTEEASPEERRVYWEQRVKNDPEDAVGRLKLCEVYWEEGLADELLRQANEILKRWPELEKTRQYQGLAYYQLGKYREALVALELAMEEYRENIDVIMSVAEIKSASSEEDLRDKKRSLELAEFGKRCRVSYQLDFKAMHWAAMATAYAENGNFEEAKKANLKAIALANEELKTNLKIRQDLYEASTPYRYPIGE